MSDPPPARAVRPDRRAHRRALAAERSVAAAVAETARWSARLLLIAASLWVLWQVVVWASPLLLPVVLALFLASILWPPVRWLRRRMPNGLAVALALLVLVGVLVGIVALLVPQVRSDAPRLVDNVQQGVDSLRKWAEGPPLNLAPAELDDIVDQGVERARGSISTIAEWLLASLGTIGSVVANLILAVLLAYFMLRDGPRFLAWVSSWAGVSVGRHVDELGTRLWTSLGSYMWAQTLVSLVDAVFIGAALWIAGVPFALVLSVIVFITGYLPIIGAFLSGLLAVLVAFAANGLGTAVAILIVVVLVQQLEGNLLAPLLVGRSLQLHPTVVLGALAIGGAVGGLIGAFLAVPAASALIVIARYCREQLHPAATSAPGETPG